VAVPLRAQLAADPEVTQLLRSGRPAELENKLQLVSLFRARQEALPEDKTAKWDTACAYASLAMSAMPEGDGSMVAAGGDPAVAEFLAPVPGLLADLDSDPAAPLSCYYALIMERAAAGDADGVISVSERAIATHPDDVPIRVKLSEVLLSAKNDPAAAREVLIPVLGSDKTPTSAATLAWIDFRAGNQGVAESEARGVLEAVNRGEGGSDAQPLLRRALLVLAAVAVAQGDYSAATEIVDYADANLPSPSVTVDKALLLILQGHGAEAKPLLEGVRDADRYDRAARAALALLEPQPQ
jgi:hypothetical protein